MRSTIHKRAKVAQMTNAVHARRVQRRELEAARALATMKKLKPVRIFSISERQSAKFGRSLGGS